MLDTIGNWDNWGVWMAGVVGGLAALGWLARKGYKLVTWIARLFKLLDKQLRRNGGASMFDRVETTASDVAHLKGTVTEIVGTVEQLLATVAELSGRFDAHLQTTAEANREMWPAVRAVAEAQPPTDWR